MYREPERLSSLWPVSVLFQASRLSRPTGLRASLYSGSGSQEGSRGGRCERNHVSAGEEPGVRPGNKGAQTRGAQTPGGPSQPD